MIKEYHFNTQTILRYYQFCCIKNVLSKKRERFSIDYHSSKYYRFIVDNENFRTSKGFRESWKFINSVPLYKNQIIVSDQIVKTLISFIKDYHSETHRNIIRYFWNSANTKTNICRRSSIMYVLVGPYTGVKLPFTDPKQFGLNLGNHKVDFSLRVRLFWFDRKVPKVVSLGMNSISKGV